jgi:SAM-dependent methyltransferase
MTQDSLLSERERERERERDAKPSWYYPIYARAFAQWRDADVRLLEIGVAQGGSLAVWRDWFPRGRIVGLDLHPPVLDDPSIALYAGSQDDTALLERIARETAPEGFDIIIDDASHVGWLSAISFWYLFPQCLRPGGIYVIEDWATGFWPEWLPDGRRYRTHLPPRLDGFRAMAHRARWARRVRHYLGWSWPPPTIPSHRAGMVALVKQVVDAVAAPDIQVGTPGAVSGDIQIEHVEIWRGQVIVHKAAQPARGLAPDARIGGAWEG